MSSDISKNIAELSESVKKYLQTRVDLIKLSILGKITRFASYLIGVYIVMFLIFVIVAFAGAAFVVWYGQAYNNYINGLLIVCGCLIVIALLFIYLREKIITNLLVRKFSEILFEEEENEEEKE